MKKLVLAITVSLLTLNSFSQNYETYKWDSVRDRKRQIEGVNELNVIRKKAGKPVLKWDDRLQPAAIHHVTYMAYCKKHHLICDKSLVDKDTAKDLSYMAHSQMFDIPNFKEIYFPMMRISLLDKTVFSEMTELLSVCGSVLGFDNSPCHWGALNNVKWDAVFVYTDEYTGVLIVILGKYVKVPVKK